MHFVVEVTSQTATLFVSRIALHFAATEGSGNIPTVAPMVGISRADAKFLDFGSTGNTTTLFFVPALFI